MFEIKLTGSIAYSFSYTGDFCQLIAKPQCLMSICLIYPYIYQSSIWNKRKNDSSSPFFLTASIFCAFCETTEASNDCYQCMLTAASPQRAALGIPKNHKLTIYSFYGDSTKDLLYQRLRSDEYIFFMHFENDTDWVMNMLLFSLMQWFHFSYFRERRLWQNKKDRRKGSCGKYLTQNSPKIAQG